MRHLHEHANHAPLFIPLVVAPASRGCEILPSFAAALIDGLYLPERRKSANASGFALVGGFLLGVTHVGFHSAFTQSLYSWPFS